MLRSVLRLTLGAAAAVSVFATPATACVGTENTATACTENRTVYRDCVYTGGSTCKDVTVDAPVCVYGTILRWTSYQTTYC